MKKYHLTFNWLEMSCVSNPNLITQWAIEIISVHCRDAKWALMRLIQPIIRLFVWHLVLSIWVLKSSILGKVYETVRLPKPLRREGWLSHYGSLDYLLFAHSILGPLFQGLFGTWTTFWSILVLKYSKFGKVHETVRLPKPLCRDGWLSHYESLGSLLFAHPIVGP